MSGVHFFPRYASKENAVTNNTMLLLSRVHAEGSELLEEFLEEVAEGVVLKVGPEFEQQVRGKGSVPDGVLKQRSFKVVLETKLGAHAWKSQLRRHLKAFRGEDAKILLVLTKAPVKQEIQDGMGKIIKEYNRVNEAPIIDAWITFNDVIEVFRSLVGDRHYELNDLIDEFEEYCGHENLLPRSHVRLRAVPCGKSFEENMKYGVYYEPPGRSATPYDYLGIYKSKEIRGVGKVVNRIQANIDGNEVHVVEAEGPVTEEQLLRIRRTATAAEEARGWDLSEGHEFVVLDKAHETSFRKSTPGGMRGTRYFDLSHVLGEEALPTADKIALELNGMTWEIPKEK